MGFLKLYFLFFSIILLYGCKTILTKSPVAAVIPEHTTESIAEIRALIGNALNGIPVTISDSVFNTSNKIILERKKVMGPDGRVIQTRIDQKPIIFEIFIVENICYLNSLDDHESYQIKKATCLKMKLD